MALNLDLDRDHDPDLSPPFLIRALGRFPLLGCSRNRELPVERVQVSPREKAVRSTELTLILSIDHDGGASVG